MIPYSQIFTTLPQHQMELETDWNYKLFLEIFKKKLKKKSVDLVSSTSLKEQCGLCFIYQLYHHVPESAVT